MRKNLTFKRIATIGFGNLMFAFAGLTLLGGMVVFGAHLSFDVQFHPELVYMDLWGLAATIGMTFIFGWAGERVLQADRPQPVMKHYVIQRHQ